ncbi:MAG TPA: GNAT family protein [Longimicrobiales bacterium]
MRVELAHPPLDGVSLFLLTPELVGDAYVGWLNDPVVNRYLESRFAVHTLESTLEFVRAMYESSDNVLLGIRSAETGGHVGNIKIGPLNRQHGTGEIGILVGERRAWGKGIATAAIRIMCDIARDSLELRKVTAGCYASNVGSQRAFEKAGFAVEGIRKQQLICDGVPEDLVLLGKVLR